MSATAWMTAVSVLPKLRVCPLGPIGLTVIYCPRCFTLSLTITGAQNCSFNETEELNCVL